MRLRSNHNNLTANPYNIAEQLYTIYSHGFTGQWSAETVLQYIAHSTLSNFSADEYGCANALNYLNQKLEAVRKTISFWDAYQILGAVDNHELILNKISQLPNNSAVINNTKDPFTWLNSFTNETEVVYQGDTFIKDYLGNVHLIHATNKGAYKPLSVEFQGGNTLSILYQYTTDIDDEPFPITTPTGSPLNITQDSGYNIRDSLDAGEWFSFESLYSPTAPNPIPIVPIVKYYLEDNAGNILDQVFIDKVCYGPTGVIIDGQNHEGWKIKNPTTLTLHFEVR